MAFVPVNQYSQQKIHIIILKNIFGTEILFVLQGLLSLILYCNLSFQTMMRLIPMKTLKQHKMSQRRMIVKKMYLRLKAVVHVLVKTHLQVKVLVLSFNTNNQKCQHLSLIAKKRHMGLGHFNSAKS